MWTAKEWISSPEVGSTHDLIEKVQNEAIDKVCRLVGDIFGYDEVMYRQFSDEIYKRYGRTHGNYPEQKKSDSQLLKEGWAEAQESKKKWPPSKENGWEYVYGEVEELKQDLLGSTPDPTNKQYKCKCSTYDVVNFGCKCGGL